MKERKKLIKTGQHQSGKCKKRFVKKR